MTADLLLCPSCAREYPASERFCESCGMPLVRGGGEERADDRRVRARKIRPEYAEGEPVPIAHVRNVLQADFLVGLLLEEGIPSYQRSVSNWRGSLRGERVILVPESAVEAAREALSAGRSGP